MLALLLGAALSASAQSFALNVVDRSGGPLAVQYRWLLQEDTTYDIVSGSAAEAALSHGFHRSYAPPVAAGDNTSGPAVITLPDPAKRYFVSVLPAAGIRVCGQSHPGHGPARHTGLSTSAAATTGCCG